MEAQYYSARSKLAVLAVWALSALIILAASNARAGREPLDTIPVPMPSNIGDFIDDFAAAEALGKALFWEQQTGGDGVQACASCHFQAGADIRDTNNVNPGADGVFNIVPGPGATVTPAMFPFHMLSDPFDRFSAPLQSFAEVMGSQGVTKRTFNGLNAPPDPTDDCTDNFMPPFGSHRQVTGRNTPPAVNAIFGHQIFWDGRANDIFNGVNPGGLATAAPVKRCDGGAMSDVFVALDHAATASQSVGPPNNDVEMACGGAPGRSFPELGSKLLDRTPLALQEVHDDDSVLGPYKAGCATGLCATDYAGLIADAFKDVWHACGRAQMEANFSLYWGITILLYERTLVSDQSKWDRKLRGEVSFTEAEKRGRRIFFGAGNCKECHAGPTLSLASSHFIDEGETVPNDGFMNIGVAMDGDDPGRQPIAGGPLAAFKAPMLRNVELSGPYMHDGSMATLEEVVLFYARGGNFRGPNTHDELKGRIGKLHREPEKVGHLVAFLKALTDERVRWEMAPFDHPELDLSAANGPHLPAIGKDGRAAEGLGPLTGFLE